MRGLGVVGLMASALALGCASDDGAGSGSGTDGSSGAAASSSTTAPEPEPGTTTGASASGTTSSATTEPAEDSSSTQPEPETDDGGGSSSGGEGVGPFEACYEGVFVNGFPGINYDGLRIPVGSHCLGTDFQDIDDVERVVFLGDSVTVGTPPTQVGDYFRNELADALADRFALSFGSNKGQWQTPNVFDGTSIVQDSGDFSSCAKWGARTDDLIAGNQISDCYPEDSRDLQTLTIITMGGNDLSKIAQESGEGAPPEVSWEIAESAVTHMRESMEWLKDAENFPNGHHVVFANVYEFTDGTGEVESCQLSGLAGFEPLTSIGDALLVIGWIEDQYARIAQETGSDFVFMFEEFQGHGFRSTDPEAPGYRGPGNENWFDLTCIHPTPTGHGAIAEMFLATISE
ncbi:MAG: SGNH/GDSL hydrolase family protein [Myxococcota bacterium]